LRVSETSARKRAGYLNHSRVPDRLASQNIDPQAEPEAAKLDDALHFFEVHRAKSRAAEPELLLA